MVYVSTCMCMSGCAVHRKLLRAGRNRLTAQNAREMCNYFAQLFLHNGSSKN